MISLREHNLWVLDKFKLLPNKEKLSCPLLVSTNQKYIDGLQNKPKVFYIGQETHGWDNYYGDDLINRNDLEDTYYKFLLNGAKNGPYWQLIKSTFGINNGQSLDSLLWSNAFICCSKETNGRPLYSKELAELSCENLKYLYNNFKPDMTIIVSGPNEPYRGITSSFLSSINPKFEKCKPSMSESIIKDEVNNVYWTYHPNFLNRGGLLKDVGSYFHEKYKILKKDV